MLCESASSAPGTCRGPARPRSWSTVSWTMRTPGAAAGVDGQLAAEREGPGRDVALRLALAAEAEVLVGEELRQREAVVQLRDVDLAEGVADARLPVGRLRGVDRGLPGQEIVRGVLLRVRAGEDGDGLDPHRILPEGA